MGISPMHHVNLHPVKRYAAARKGAHMCVTLFFATCEIAAAVFAHDMTLLHIGLTSSFTCWEVAVLKVSTEGH